HECVAAPISDSDSADGCDQRKKQSFCEKLFDQSTPPRTQRETYRYLVSAQQRSREQEIAHVRARDEQDKKHDRHCDCERRRHVSRLIERCSPQRRKRQVMTAIRFRILFFQPLRNCVKLSVRLPTRYARFEKCVAFDPTRTAVF